MNERQRPQVSANVYRGEVSVTHRTGIPNDRTALQRTLPEYEIALNYELDRPRFHIDLLVMEQLLHAKRYRKKEITILDIGSGEAFWMKDFLDKPELLPQSR